MYIQVLLLLFAIVMLYFGAEFALESAEKIGKYFGLSPLVIGLLIIGFGTSLPEFFVSQFAAFRNEAPIAMGNIVGSNIANLFLILGVSALITPLCLKDKEILKQQWFHVVLTALLAICLLQPQLYIWCGALLVSFFIVYMVVLFKGMKSTEEDKQEEAKEAIGIKVFLHLIAGFVLLFYGGEVLVSSGSKLALIAGVDSFVISAIFVAFGTSFPELVTAILACKKKKNTDIIVGNIIGSNIFNVSFVLASLTGYKITISHDYTVEIIVLSVCALFMLGLSLLKLRLNKLTGLLFLGTYLGMVYYWI